METREVARRALTLLAPGRAAAAPAPPRSPGPARAEAAAPRPGPPGRRRAARLVGLAALLAAVGPACAAPVAPGGAHGAPARLYGAHALGDTVAQLDAASGRPVGAPLPAGPLPDQVAPGPGGGLLVLSQADAHAGEVTLVARAGRHLVG